MAELPVQIGQTVEVQQVPSQFSTAQFTPEDFGAGIGKEMMKLGSAIQEKMEQERKLKADFDAVNADHEFVKREAEIWAKFKETVRPDQYKAQLPNYLRELEALSPKVMKEMGLSDPYAQKAFHNMTRRRIDYRMANATVYAEDQYETWMDNTAVGSVAAAEQKARENPPNILPDGAVDTRDLGHDLQEAAHLRMERLSRKLPPEVAAKYVHADQVKVIEGALNGYLGAEDPEAMKAFLDAPIAGLNDANGIPLTPKRILGAKWKEWEKKSERLLGEKKGDALGFAALQETAWDGPAARASLLEKQTKGEITQPEFTAAAEAVDKHLRLHQGAIAKQVASDERIVWDAFNANGQSVVGMAKTPEQRLAWDRMQSTDLPLRLKNASIKDEARDMLVGTKWVDWLAKNYDKATDMSLDELLKIARGPDVGMTVYTEKYVLPSINRFIMEKNPLRKRGETQVASEGRVDVIKALGKEYDIARPELNDPRNWDDPVERKAVALYTERLTEWLGEWYSNPENHKRPRPTTEEYIAAMGQYLEMAPVPAGDRTWYSIGEQKEPRIKQMARDALRQKPTGNVKDIEVKAPEAPKPAPAPAPKKDEIDPEELKLIDAALAAEGRPITDANRRAIWNARRGK